LLSTAENAAINSTKYKDGKPTTYLHSEDKKRNFLQLVHRFYRPGRTDTEINNLVDSFLLTQPGGDAAELRRVKRPTKLSWIKKYKQCISAGKEKEALLLVPAQGKKTGRKPVFSPEVEEDMSKCLSAWLAAAPAGVCVDFVVAHLKGLLQAPEKFAWRMCINAYNRKSKHPFEFNHQWVREHMLKWGFSFRQGTTVARKLPDNVEEVHDLFITRLAYTLRRDLPQGLTMVKDGKEVAVKMIPPDLCVNSDQGGIPWVAFRDATWARTGVKAVPLMGHDDKRQMTAVLSSNAAGVVLPLQVIMTGKTEGSLPAKEDRSAAEREGFHYTVTDNHWANLETSKEFVGKVLQPFLNQQRERLQLPLDFPAVWIIDCWPVHISANFLTFMGERYPNIRLLFVPANCTGRMQPADLCGQRELKCCLKAIGTMFATVQVREALKKLAHLSEEDREKKIQGGAIKIDTSLTKLKPLVADWHLAAWRHLQAKGALFKGWEQSLLLKAFDEHTGPVLYQLAQAKVDNDTLWTNTQVIVPGGVPVPAGVERVRVRRVVQNDAGEDVEVEVEEDVPEPKESEQDIADMNEELTRCATAAEKVCISMHVFFLVFVLLMFC
jgi:hypothetical protein